MTITTAGSIPQYYQWQFDGTNLVNATNAFFSLTNVQFTNNGDYSIIVTNAYGSVTGLVATLTVMDLGLALDATNFIWTTSSSYPWFPETSTNHDGIAAAQSSTPLFPQSSYLQTTVTGPGTLTFWAQCSQFNDRYRFSTTGSYRQTRTIPVPFFSPQWVQETVDFSAGTQSLQWTFDNYFPDPGLDVAWLDQVNFVPGGTPAMITGNSSDQIVRAGSNVAYIVFVTGTPPFSFQWNLNGNAIVGATNNSITVTNVQPTNAGIYSVTVSNAYGLPISTNMMLIVQTPLFDTSSGNMFMNSQGFNFQLGGLTAHGPVIIFASTNLKPWRRFSRIPQPQMPFRF